MSKKSLDKTKRIGNVWDQDAKWRAIAEKMCGDYDTAQDIVQEMYLKLMHRKDIQVDWFVVMTMRNLWLNGKKKNREDRFPEDWVETSGTTEQFEPNDEQQVYLDRFAELPFLEQEIIEESYDRSLREIGDEFNINYGYVHKVLHRGLKHVLQDDYADYKNSRKKYQKPKGKHTK